MSDSIVFSELLDSIVIIRKGGVYKQTKAYQRRGYIYVAAAGGFVLMRKDNRTSVPNLSWLEIETNEKRTFDEHGRMMVK